MKTVRKLVLGETWSLPLGIGLAVVAAFVVRGISGAAGWWTHAGGLVLLVLLVVAFVASLRLGR